MVILKFALLFFVAYLAWMLALRQYPRAPVGGPYYYADAPGARNPVDPRWRLRDGQAWRMKRFCKVWFDSASRPTEVQHWRDGAEAWSQEYVWTKDGSLRQRRWSAGGRVLRVDDLPRPAERPPTPTPTPRPGGFRLGG